MFSRGWLWIFFSNFPPTRFITAFAEHKILTLHGSPRLNKITEKLFDKNYLSYPLMNAHYFLIQEEAAQE